MGKRVEESDFFSIFLWILCCFAFCNTFLISPIQLLFHISYPETHIDSGHTDHIKNANTCAARSSRNRAFRSPSHRGDQVDLCSGQIARRRQKTIEKHSKIIVGRFSILKHERYTMRSEFVNLEFVMCLIFERLCNLANL